MPPTPGTPVAIRPAATVLLLRDADAGPEVFMLRRTETAAFLGGAYVFPGGAVDPDDGSPDALARIVGLAEPVANARLGVASGALAFWFAAARECFEEAGIVLAWHADGEAAPRDVVAAMDAHRAAVNRGDASFAALLAAHALLIRGDDIAYLDHWITPPIRPRRFDTRFFVARAPLDQEGSHDNAETVHSAWIAPATALQRADRREIDLALVTREVLRGLLRFSTVEAALHATRIAVVDAKRPAVAQGAKGQRIFGPGDAPYHEIHWTDPGETTQASYDLAPGVPRRLDRWVTRIIAPNPGMMTGPGTNTYLVGESALAVIDPGPLIPSHVDAILAAGAGRIRWILGTHTHRDHSPAAAALKAATGATIIGRAPPPDPVHDHTFAPDMIPAHGEMLALDDLRLRVLHTPGHASNHLCYLLDVTKMLFTGDHVMQGSTVVINPPDGDMRAYLASLDALLALDIAIIAPGHGYLLGTPQREVRRLIEHRLRREAKVLRGVDQLGRATVDELLPVVYDEVHQQLWPVARRSLVAHLQKLVADGTLVLAVERYARASTGNGTERVV